MSTAAEFKARGNAAFANKEYKKAAKIYRDAIKLDPTNAVLFSNRAQCFINLEDWARALRDTEDGLNLKPEEKIVTKLLFRRGIAAKKSNDLQLAQTCFNEVLSIDPTNAQAMLEIASLDGHKKIKLSSSSTVNIPIEMVNELPSEFAEIVNPSPIIQEKPMANPQLVEEIANSLFKNKKLSSQPSSSANASPQRAEVDTLPTMHYLKTLAVLPESQKLKGYRLVLDLTEDILADLFQSTGLDAEFFEFYVEAAENSIRTGGIASQVILRNLQFLSTLKRYDIALLLCPSSLVSRLLELVKTYQPEQSVEYHQLFQRQ